MSGAATGQTAADVSFSRPAVIPTDLIIGYNGAARVDAAQVQAWGKPFLMGFESATTRSYAGGDAGEQDSAYSCGQFDGVGYPRECGSWVCAADASSTATFYVSNITDYGYRYALRQIAGGRSGPILVYGNPTAVEALCAGTRNAGLIALRWGVGTWGYGEGGGAYQLPASSGADLLQSGNTPGPAAGTDYNALYAPLNLFNAWGGPASAPVSAPKDEDMIPLVQYIGDPGHTVYRIEHADGLMYRIPCSPAELAVLAKSGAVAFAAPGVPLIGQLDATEFTTLHDLPVPPRGAAIAITDAQVAALAAAVSAKIVTPTHLNLTGSLS